MSKLNTICKNCGADLTDWFAFDQITPNYLNDNHQIEMDSPTKIVRFYCLNCGKTIRSDRGFALYDYIIDKFGI